ncbi:MAG: hypothetical protein ACR2OZ_18430 [Verrucomicrobiales bacterium]
MQITATVRLGLLSLVSAIGLGACASGDAISKVKIFRLDSTRRVTAADPAIAFEQRHYLHGAITAEEVRAREGNYYTVFWSVADPRQPVTLRFEYRQAKTGSKVHVIESIFEDPSAQNTTDVQVIGDAFQQGGSVLAWRASLVRDKEILATRRSYLWE